MPVLKYYNTVTSQWEEAFVGATGETGPSGPTGPQGIQGPAGADGSDGAVGVTGATGPTGPQGDDGVVISSTPPTNTSLLWIDTTDTASGGGATGATGPQGPAGADGSDGADGAVGVTGATGPQGPAGADGSDGVDGAIGVTGATGPQGPAGADGSDGADGAVGVTGATGPQGPAGADGTDGVDGAIGVTGATGPQGPAGADGSDGVDGAVGVTGATGPTGPQGDDGIEAGVTAPTDTDVLWLDTSSAATDGTGATGPTGPTEYNTAQAQWTLSGGGRVTWTGDRLHWSQRVIAIPSEKPEFSQNGFFGVTCPTSGTITAYTGTSGSTSVTCTTQGVPISGWQALWAVLQPGGTAADYTLVITTYTNTTWNPGIGWILLAVKNADTADSDELKWMPGQLSFPANGGQFDTYHQSASWTVEKQGAAIETQSGATTATLDLSTGKVFNVTLGVTASTIAITNMPSAVGPSNGVGVAVTVILKYPVTTTAGAAITRSVAWWSGVKWPDGTAPTLTNIQGKEDVFTFLSTDNGANWYGFIGGQNF